MKNKVDTSLETDVLDEGPFYHGTKADLQLGDLLTAGLDRTISPNSS